jgi:hypothetical protein
VLSSQTPEIEARLRERGAAMIRRNLPQRRASENFDLRFWSQNFTVTVGFYADGMPGEGFIDGGKTGQDIQSTARDAAVEVRDEHRGENDPHHLAPRF